MVFWHTLPEWEKAQSAFLELGVEPESLSNIISRCSKQKSYSDCLFYIHHPEKGARTLARDCRVRLTTNCGVVQKRVHFILYQWFVEKIPDGTRLFNHCGDPCCVNPYHFSAQKVRPKLPESPPSFKPTVTGIKMNSCYPKDLPLKQSMRPPTIKESLI